MKTLGAASWDNLFFESLICDFLHLPNGIMG
jgi:hypothetical protein